MTEQSAADESADQGQYTVQDLPEPAPANQSRLAGKTAVVTGASRGIGLAIARRFAAEGAKVLITARNIGPLKEAAAEFPEGSVLFLAGKSDDPDHRAEVLDTVARTWGTLDILVNNAGINPVYGPLTELDPEAARRILDVNVLGTLAWVQALCAHPALDFTGRGGSVLNLSSVSAQTPAHGIGFYGISKAAVEQLTRTLAMELAPSVRVNAMAPAVVKTQFARALYEGREEKVSSTYPLKRLGTPEDVAGAAAFLVSDDAAWVTGQVLNLDGGLLVAGGSA
ncbi:SDR family oxidoreductase [Arthrobacter sp. zg-Y20]|uniref:SDR family oxidoreductase n=1 Tax=unclassified Arthrobacter TaxID=235627 RepID=UPI001D13C32E|nr:MULTISPECIES: SDR family oxidoreductase [unclassified Arthrobacter]MCC3275205.1 SDR family oxidoreductase [Arthrobacter sp. zg-Y20]MDK1315362.1 SDR family oxidoreductase [Arthrobacter sp. zg.Y20]WIB05780.1 SDR family oxidoreductase [Arthrobacter sp. zg-Y20]